MPRIGNQILKSKNSPLPNGLFLFSFCLFATFLLQAQAWAEPSNQNILINGTTIHYIRKGQGTPLVLIHGTYSSLNVYKRSIFDQLASTYDVIAFDLPGYGQSKRPKLKMTFDERIDMIRQAIQKLRIDQPILVGHSSGGSFALRYALKYPDELKALTLISPYIEGYAKSKRIYRIATAPAIGNLFFYTVVKPLQFIKRDWTFAKPGFYPNPVDQQYADQEVGLALRRKTFRANAYDVQTLGPTLLEIQDRYGEIKIPVIIITGEEDKISPLYTNGGLLHKKIIQSKLIVLPQTGHNPLFTNPEDVIQAIYLAATSGQQASHRKSKTKNPSLR